MRSEVRPGSLVGYWDRWHPNRILDVFVVTEVSECNFYALSALNNRVLGPYPHYSIGTWTGENRGMEVLVL